jgi:hypothetical protein
VRERNPKGDPEMVREVEAQLRSSSFVLTSCARETLS